MKETGGPAFPAIWSHGFDQANYPRGMTLQDWFAGQALEGAVAGRAIWPTGHVAEMCAKECYDLADAMIAERTRRGKD